MRTLMLVPALVALLTPGGAGAQGCGKGRPEATLGIVTSCADCTVQQPGEATTWVQYRTPPVVVRTERGFRASSPLRKGDLILMVDGEDIRTEKASRRLAAPAPRTPVTLAIQRGASALTVTVTPIRTCPER